MRKELYIKALARCSNDKDEYYAKTIARMSDTIGIKNIEIENLSENVERLEKTLDKACEWIVNYIGECPMAQFDKFLSNCEEDCCDDFVGCWKEWLLKEVQEDDGN